jgi:hypothetical protein
MSNNTTNSQNQVLSQQIKSAENSIIKQKSEVNTHQRIIASTSIINSKSQITKTPTDFLPRTTDITRLAEITSRLHKDLKAQTSINLNNSNTNVVNSIGYKTPLKTNVTNLSLKPATVEVYFRNNSGNTKKIERKSLHSTIFPPPKIGLKS